MIRILILILAFTASLNALNVNYKKYFKNRAGKRAYQKQNFEKAIQEFNENAISNPNSGIAHYNLGNAFFKRQQFEEAETEYNLALKDKNLKNIDEVYHNLGNINLNKKDLPKAVDFFRKALLENPNNFDARYNYELASKMLEKQNQDQKQKGQDKQNKDNKEEEKENKDQQKQQEQKNKDNKENKQQNQEQKNKDKQKQNKQNQPKEEKQKINQKLADQILKNIENEEKKNQKKKKVPVKLKKTGKYW